MAKKKKRTTKERRRSARPKRKSAAKKRAAAPSLDALARKIVRMTQKPDFAPADLGVLYTEDCTSQEASGQIARGLAGLEESSSAGSRCSRAPPGRRRTSGSARRRSASSGTPPSTLRDGRTVSLREVAVHEIKSGKIQNERFYYNPMALAPPTA